MIPSPAVFDGTAYTRRLHPIACNVKQSLTPLGTVNLTVPGTDEVSYLDWVRIETPDGEIGYYRVSNISTDAVTGDKNVYLEHGACTLGDIIVPDASEAKQKTSGSSHGADLVDYMEDKTDTIANILTYILGKQGTGGRWAVGTVEATATVYIELGNSSLLDSISTLLQYIPDYQAEFKQNSESDWRVNIKARPTTPVCEARLGRNLKTCDVSYDTKNICTRVYCDGITGGHMDSPNISVYGVRTKTQSLNKDLSTAQKEAIVSAYLSNHDHPTVSVNISGAELSQLTGLTIDKFAVGSVCRLAIPSLGMTVDEVVIEKDYPDIYGSPEEVTVTLANAMPDLAIAIAAVTSHGGGGMAGKVDKAEKELKRFETHFEQTDEYFKLIATDTEWDDMGEGTVTAYGQIVLTATSFDAVVQQIGADGTITAASIALAINAQGSGAYINADHIYLNATSEITLAGMVHATGTTFQIEGGVSGDGTLTCNTIECYNLEADGEVSADNVQTGTLYVDGNEAEWQSMTVVTGVSVSLPALGQSETQDFLYIKDGQEYTYSGRVVTSWSRGSVTPSTDTIYYLGR